MSLFHVVSLMDLVANDLIHEFKKGHVYEKISATYTKNLARYYAHRTL